VDEDGLLVDDKFRDTVLTTEAPPGIDDNDAVVIDEVFPADAVCEGEEGPLEEGPEGEDALSVEADIS
jgi:hypothetical protein